MHPNDPSVRGKNPMVCPRILRRGTVPSSCLYVSTHTANSETHASLKVHEEELRYVDLFHWFHDIQWYQRYFIIVLHDASWISFGVHFVLYHPWTQKGRRNQSRENPAWDRRQRSRSVRERRTIRQFTCRWRQTELDDFFFIVKHYFVTFQREKC